MNHMKTETLGTVVAGELRLDQQLDLPDRSRVRVAIEPVEAWQSRLEGGLRSWMAYSDENPVHGGGQKYSREELHERG